MRDLFRLTGKGICFIWSEEYEESVWWLDYGVEYQFYLEYDEESVGWVKV